MDETLAPSWMIAPPIDSFAIRAQLETLHAESFAWALTCCAFDPAEAEDVLQMSYLKILENRARYSGHSAFKTWLFGVIRFTAWEHRRWSWLRRGRHAPLEEAAPEAAVEPQPDAAAARNELVAEVQAACQRLSARQREVLMLVFHHDLALDDAAAVMGISSGAARQHYHRGKEQLRTLLGPHFSKCP